MRQLFRRVLLAAPVAGLLATGIMASPAQAYVHHANTTIKTGASTCTVSGTFTWSTRAHNAGVSSETLQISDDTTGTLIIDLKRTDTAQNGQLSASAPGTSGHSYHAFGEVFDNVGNPYAWDTSRTVTLQCH